jgi:hypothetical protein
MLRTRRHVRLRFIYRGHVGVFAACKALRQEYCTSRMRGQVPDWTARKPVPLRQLVPIFRVNDGSRVGGRRRNEQE